MLNEKKNKDYLLDSLSAEEKKALTELRLQGTIYADKYLMDQPIKAEKKGELGIRIHFQKDVLHIEYARTFELMRALLLVASELSSGKKLAEISLSQRPCYEELSYMPDCSRNAVLTVEEAKNQIRTLACMGYSSFSLYMEDVYEIEGQPYFGYMRGRYTSSELQEIEEYAHIFGMTFVPCIQTLAHLNAFMRWEIDDIKDMRDINDILLVGEQKTYELIDGMFASMAKLQTRKINIGMDEAHMLGLGKYLNQNGVRERSLIMCEHLQKVLDIADKYGFSCQMWSDMFFNLMSKSAHYGTELEIPAETKELIDQLKDRVELIYWDYYQIKVEKYSERLKQHQQISDKIVFAGGVWKWIGFSPQNTYSEQVATAAHEACKNFGIKEVVITGWGDNGGECSQMAILPALMVWAELNYTSSKAQLDKMLLALTGLSYKEFLLLDSANAVPDWQIEFSGINPGRYIFYQDLLCPLLEKHLMPKEYHEHYSQAARAIQELIDRQKSLAKASPYLYIFETQKQLLEVLSQKVLLPSALREAYENKDKTKLLDLIDKISKLISEIDEFDKVFSKQWLKENKVFGLDTYDIRSGGLKQRLERARSRIKAYLTEEITQIAELEEKILPFDDFYKGVDMKARAQNQWHLIATVSTIER